MTLKVSDSTLKLKIAPKLDHSNNFAFTGEDWHVSEYPTHGPHGENWTKDDWKTAIDIFEERLRGRYFNYAEMIIKYEFGIKDYHAGFLITALDCLIVETLQQFYDGRDSSQGSEKSFERFLTETSFGDPDLFGNDTSDGSLADIFYDQIRCGILHQAEVKTDSRIVSSRAKLVEREGKGVKVNRREFHNKLVEEFENYIKRLRNPKSRKDEDDRLKFRQKMDYICKVKEPLQKDNLNLYFAYGSNMSSRRMKKRTPSAKFKGIACLPKKRLVFNKISKDGSGKANIVDDVKSNVWGVLYEIKKHEMDRLDKDEAGYQRITVHVKTDKLVNAITYISLGLNDAMLPLDTYKKWVVEGAREYSLPPEYIAQLGSVPSKPASKQEKSKKTEKKS